MQLSSICSQLADTVLVAGYANKTASAAADRSYNVVVSGVEENMDRDVWMSSIHRALHTAAGHDVDIADAFCLGHCSEQRNRLVLKLSS